MAMAVQTRKGSAAGALWDKYNIIATSGRMARRTLAIKGRITALVVFFFFANFALIFGALWVMMDVLATWEWTSFLTPTLDTGAAVIAGSATSAATAGYFLRAVLQLVSFVPSAFELAAPYFADEDEILAGLFIVFCGFDFYTDWDKSSQLAANMDYSGWRDILGMGWDWTSGGEWIATALLTLFSSLLAQYLMILFLVIAACAAWRILFND